VAVDADEQRRRQHDLRFLPGALLEMPAHDQVEELVGAAELDVSAHFHRVETLQQRIQELHQRDRHTARVTLREVVAFEHARDRHL
jgi:hypothetical protein